jgi:predicted dehydrogenase
MAALRVGIIGCGRPKGTDDATGYGMSHWHAEGYAAVEECDLVALADINLDNARAFQAEHGGDAVYADYRQMLADAQLDIVSVCTWPSLHTGMVVAAAEAGVQAIYCEKPMAPTLGDAQRMVSTCDSRGVVLAFNHQRRFGDRFRKAKSILDTAEIGTLTRIEGRCANLFDWGTHWFDMFNYFNNEMVVEWVLGQFDARDGATLFGITMEGQGLSHFRYANGVHGLLTTGFENGSGAQIRLIGTDGTVEISPAPDVPLRYWTSNTPGWTQVEIDEPAKGVELTKLGILDLVASLRSGHEPEVSGRKALRATELIFATYESGRQGSRIEIPLPGAIHDRSISDYVQERIATSISASSS